MVEKGGSVLSNLVHDILGGKKGKANNKKPQEKPKKNPDVKKEPKKTNGKKSGGVLELSPFLVSLIKEI